MKSGLAEEVLLAQDQRIHEMVQRSTRIEDRLNVMDGRMREIVVSLRAMHLRIGNLPCADHEHRLKDTEATVQTVRGAAVTLLRRVAPPLAIGLLGGYGAGNASALVALLTSLFK